MHKLLALLPLLYSLPSNAGFIQYFKDENGETKWQYVANFSSSVLILLLSVALVTLFFSHSKKVRANRALKEIRDALEERVKDRTATLDQSNQLLKEANTALNGEMEQHRETTRLLKYSEAYIKNILQSMPSMLIGLDGDLNITQWNDCAEQITGISHEKALGKNLWQAYPTITISPEQIKDVLVSGISSTIKHSQRGQYYFDIRIFPLKGQLGHGVVIIIDNVTQRSLAENMLIQRDKMSSMGELAATMAHDIELPLRAISNDLDTILKTLPTSSGGEDEKISALLHDARERGTQVSSVIRNLLEFSRSQGDKKRPASMTTIVDHAIELAHNTLSDPTGLRFSDITIERHYEDNLPEIPCFVSEMQQVFLSLFRHCVHALAKANKEDITPTIMVEVTERYDALWMKVQHNGLGLTGEEQQDIFEPFVNTWPLKKESSEAENRLSFTHFILVDHHQGQVAITSDVEVGTTFHIQLQL
ncbi:two-component system sensor histidine kinase NtrB [Agarilytica rhodophyticola]|uniref:two-component system sensor histidine kinase NtrB n=1 Tax=Agarilytica rhodophyticola TaxID=1737490 RepID=UPI000B344954|nr:ATP-binding protein [Agarilytica rhodophyticola]